MYICAVKKADHFKITAEIWANCESGQTHAGYWFP